MTNLAARLTRPEVLALPSRPAAAETAGEVRLDRNEAPFAMTGAAAEINRFPPDQPAALLARFAAIAGVSPANALLARDIDDAIDLLTRVFCRPGEDAIAVSAPTARDFAFVAALQGARLVAAPLKALSDFEPESFRAKAAGAKLAFLASPTDVSGALIAADEILALCDMLPETLIIVDESYIEFSGAKSLAPEAARRENLVVLRSLSYAYGIAGARIGAIIANPDVIALLSKAAPFAALPSPAIAEAARALSPLQAPIIEQRVAAIIEERERLAVALASSPFIVKVYPSAANFLFLETKDSAALKQRLGARGIRVAWLGEIGPGALRLAIGGKTENNLVLDAFKVETQARSERRAEIARETRETKIAVAVDLDRAEPVRIDTGVGYFDHMLEQVARHGGFSLILSCDGDTHVDAHHTIEDCMLAFGSALREALGERRGVARFGAALPMDEAEAEALIDLSGRPCAVFEGAFEASLIGAYPTEMTSHAVRSLAESLRAAVHVKTRGENDHHKTEAGYKALGRALRQAIRIESDQVPSSKGMLA